MKTGGHDAAPWAPSQRPALIRLGLLGFFLAVFALTIYLLSGTGDAAYERLHLLLDTANGTLSLMLALFMAAEQTTIGTKLRTCLVIGFGLTAATEILHALVGIEWSGPMAWVSEFAHTIRPATWPPSAYVLPLSLLLLRKHFVSAAALRPALFATSMLLLTLALFALAYVLPKYMDTGILGIQRPTQAPLILVLLFVIVGYWRLRHQHRLAEGIALMSGLLLVSDLSMLYSTAPHEKAAMMAHVGKLLAYVLFHVYQMRLAADDARARTVAEKALLQEQQRLKDLLKTLTQQATELVLAQKVADSANQAKSAFLANMSHEIRTPLNAVIGLLQIIQAGASDPQQLDQIGKARTAAKSLLGLLNDILDFSKIESGKLTLDPNPFDLRGLMGELRVILDSYGAHSRLKLRVETDATIPRVLVGDSLRLQQVLINLGGNAIKFTPTGTVTVTVSLLTATATDVQVRFAVRDTGIGIAPDQQAKIFEDFGQADASTTRRFGGTGLGLAISRRLIELMGGTLHLSSELGHGSVFSFDLRLPIGARTPQAPVARAVPQPTGRSLAGLSVLLVDDVAMNREVAVALLAMEGALVTSAENGQLAIDCLEQGNTPVDVVLMDMQMPVMDGLQATQFIRQRLKLTDLPVIAMTANASTEDRQACLQAGMNDHLVKPFDLPVLVDMIRKWVPTAAALPDAPPPAHAPLPGKPPQANRWPESFNTAAALVRLGNDARLYEKLLRGLATQLQTLCKQMTEAELQGDARALASGAHAIKGVALTVGADRLSHAAAQLEQGLKTLLREPSGTSHPAGLDWPALTKPLWNAVEQTQAALQRWTTDTAPGDAPAPGSPGTPASRTALTEGLQTLQGLLAQADMTALDCFDRLVPLLQAVPDLELEPLGAAMEVLDFEAATQAVARLLETP